MNARSCQQDNKNLLTNTLALTDYGPAGRNFHTCTSHMGRTGESLSLTSHINYRVFNINGAIWNSISVGKASHHLVDRLIVVLIDATQR